MPVPLLLKGGWVLVITELRATFFLVVSFVFFFIIIGLLGLSTIMSADRWSERTKAGG